MRSGVLRRSFVLLLLSVREPRDTVRVCLYHYLLTFTVVVRVRRRADGDWSSCSVPSCSAAVRASAQTRCCVSSALLLLLRERPLPSAFAARAASAASTFPADARGSLIAEGIRAARRVGVYAACSSRSGRTGHSGGLCRLESFLSFWSFLRLLRGAAAFACCSVCCSAAFSRRTDAWHSLSA